MVMILIYVAIFALVTWHDIKDYRSGKKSLIGLLLKVFGKRKQDEIEQRKQK